MNETLLIAGIVGIFLFVCVFLESLIIMAFRKTHYKQALLHAVIVNIASLLAMYAVWPLISRMDIDEDKVFPLLPLLFLTTLIIEALLLKVLNRLQPWLRILLTTFVMNTASFAVLYCILSLL